METSAMAGQAANSISVEAQEVHGPQEITATTLVRNDEDDAAADCLADLIEAYEAPGDE